MWMTFRQARYRGNELGGNGQGKVVTVAFWYGLMWRGAAWRLVAWRGVSRRLSWSALGPEMKATVLSRAKKLWEITERTGWFSGRW